MDRSQIIAQISKYLTNRRVVFFTKYTNPTKQQTIIDAEKQLVVLNKLNHERFKDAVRQYANKYILPLLPAKQSRFHQSYFQLYQDLIS